MAVFWQTFHLVDHGEIITSENVRNKVIRRRIKSDAVGGDAYGTRFVHHDARVNMLIQRIPHVDIMRGTVSPHQKKAFFSSRLAR